MAKWLILAAGVFLFFNGMLSRTYPSVDPGKHCFNMDYIRLFGCFSTTAVPQVIVWGATLIGAVLVIWSFLRGRQQQK